MHLPPRLSSAVSVVALAATLAIAPAARAVTASVVTPTSVITQAPDPAHEILSAAFQAETDLRSHTRLTSGNRFELLENGVVSFPAKHALVATATAQVMVMTMSWAWDPAGKAMADALVRKARQGVEVRAVVDGLVADPRIVHKLRDGGVKVARFNFLGLNIRRSGRMHEKVVCVDFARAIVGGMNIRDDFALGNGRNDRIKDTDILVEGPLAAEVARRFLELYTSLDSSDAGAAALLGGIGAHAQNPPAAAPGQAGYGRLIAHEPDLGRRYITDYYVRAIRAAKSQIVWHVKYIAPEEPLLSELKAAAWRGVRVVLVTNSPRAYREHGGGFTAFFLDLWTRTLNLRKLGGSLIEVWEYDHYIHSKALTIDGVLASVGSYNFDMWSIDRETEQTVVTHDPAAVRAVEEMFERDLALSRRIH